MPTIDGGDAHYVSTNLAEVGSEKLRAASSGAAPASQGNNIMLPLVALGTSLYVGWVAPRGFLRDQVTNEGQYKPGFAKACQLILRWVAPVAIITIFLSNIL